MQYKGEVIAITLTPVRHKRHMQFLTSAANFRGSAVSCNLAFLRPCNPVYGYLFILPNSIQAQFEASQFHKKISYEQPGFAF